MKNRNVLLTVAVILGMISGLTAQNVPSYVPTNGLVGWWPFNGNANDESGNGNNGTVNEATLTADRIGNTNKAYEFNGTSSYINVPNSSLLQFNGGLTISVWVKPTNLPSPLSYILSKGADGGTPNSWCFTTGGTASPPAHRPNLTVYDNGTALVAKGVATNQPLILNNWVNLTFSFDGANARCYINGVFEASSPTTYNVFSNIYDLKFGRRHVGGSPYFFTGIMDDFGIWNRALTQQEITALYQGDNTTANCLDLPTNLQQGLVGYWPFCGNANDESGNGNNGTVNGATLTADRFGNGSSAYHFDGISNKIDILNYNQNPQNFTASLWFKAALNGMSGTNEFLHRCQPGDRFNFCWNLSWGLQNNQNYLHTVINSTSGPMINQTGNGLPINIWQMVTMTFDGITKRIYVNGNLLDSLTIGNTSIDYTGKSGVYLGYDSEMDYFNGSLDDIAIWNRALSPQEITQLYNQGICKTSITVTDTLLIHTGITSYNPVAYQNTLKVWPNPGNQDITIDAGNLALMQGWKIRISNAQGVQIYPSGSQSGLINQQQQTLDMSGWGGNGLYFLYLIDPQNNIQEVKKIVLAP